MDFHDLARILKGEGYQGTVSLVGFYPGQMDVKYESMPFLFEVG